MASTRVQFDFDVPTSEVEKFCKRMRRAAYRAAEKLMLEGFAAHPVHIHQEEEVEDENQQGEEEQEEEEKEEEEEELEEKEEEEEKGEEEEEDEEEDEEESVVQNPKQRRPRTKAPTAEELRECPLVQHKLKHNPPSKIHPQTGREWFICMADGQPAASWEGVKMHYMRTHGQKIIEECCTPSKAKRNEMVCIKLPQLRESVNMPFISAQYYLATNHKDSPYYNPSSLVYRANRPSTQAAGN